jgi:hypothetical protein
MATGRAEEKAVRTAAGRTEEKAVGLQQAGSTEE